MRTLNSGHVPRPLVDSFLRPSVRRASARPAISCNKVILNRSCRPSVVLAGYRGVSRASNSMIIKLPVHPLVPR